MHDDFEDEIRELVDSGNKIEAVKRYREETGVGLAEAKAAVEAISDGHSVSRPDTTDDGSLADQVISLLERGEKIPAVKLYREQKGVGLKEAKEAVERLGEQHGIPASSGAGCLGMVLMLVGVIAAAAS